jgi:hypothetical protein
MSTYANGTQQTYQEIWAAMELACASLMPAIRSQAGQPASAAEPIIDLTPSAVAWQDTGAGGHRRKHPLRIPRRSARGRRRIAARTR